jgi:hypothetical protein
MPKNFFGRRILQAPGHWRSLQIAGICESNDHESGRQEAENFSSPAARVGKNISLGRKPGRLSGSMIVVYEEGGVKLLRDIAMKPFIAKTMNDHAARERFQGRPGPSSRSPP